MSYLARLAPSGECLRNKDRIVHFRRTSKTAIPLTRAIPERTGGGLRRCAIQIDLYLFTLFYIYTTILLPVLDGTHGGKPEHFVAAEINDC